MTRISVVPRCMAEGLNLDDSHVIISITDPPPDGEPVMLNACPARLGALHLAFHDFDKGDIDGSGKLCGKPFRHWAMREDQALEIWEFIKKHRVADVIIVNCEAGVSRSPSVAMAIADKLGLGRASIDWHGNWDPRADPPNRHVYDMMTRAKMPVEVRRVLK